MDFEFNKYRRTDTVLISGGVGQNIRLIPIRKFEGLPLIISSKNEIREIIYIEKKRNYFFF